MMGAVHRSGEQADLRLLPVARRSDAAREQADGEHGERDDAEHEQQQDPVEHRHGDDRADEDDDATCRVDEPLRHHRVEQRRVRSDPGDEVAGATRVETPGSGAGASA